MSGSVGTLRKLARFYKTNILDFFDANESSGRRVRPAERKVLEAGAGVRMELLAWGNTVMEPHLFRIAPDAGSGDPYTHEGEEFIYVMRGDLEITVDGEDYRLKPGDSFYFESATPASLEKSRPERNVVALGEYSPNILNFAVPTSGRKNGLATCSPLIAPAGNASFCFLFEVKLRHSICSYGKVTPILRS